MSIIGSLAKVAKKVADVGKNLIGLVGTGPNSHVPKGQANTPIDADGLHKATEVLGLIYRSMVRAREDEISQMEIEKSFAGKQAEDEDNRNDELIKALTLKRKPAKKVKKPKVEKEEPTPEKQKPTKKKTKTEEEPTKEAPKPTKKEEPTKEAPKPTKKEEPKPTQKEKVPEKVKEEAPKKEAPKAKKEVKESAKPPKAERVTPAKPGAVPKITGESDIKNMIMSNEGKGLPGKPGQPYKDSKGLWTIGVGHLIGDGKSLPPEWNRTLSDDEMKTLFEKDYDKHKTLAEKFPNFKNFNLSGQAALIDLAFNIPKALSWPIFNKQLSEMDVEGAAKNLEGTDWYKQVGNRAPKTVALLRNGAGIVPTNQALPSNLTPSTGTKIDSASKENKDMKDVAANTKKQQTINNTSLLQQQSSSGSQVTSGSDVDDRNPYQKKK